MNIFNLKTFIIVHSSPKPFSFSGIQTPQAYASFLPSVHNFQDTVQNFCIFTIIKQQSNVNYIKITLHFYLFYFILKLMHISFFFCSSSEGLAHSSHFQKIIRKNIFITVRPEAFVRYLI